MGLVALFKQWFGIAGAGSEAGSGNSGRKGRSGGGNGTAVGNFKDLKITCAECRKGFTFEAGEQQFYKSRGLSSPKRCNNCRNKRKRHHR